MPADAAENASASSQVPQWEDAKALDVMTKNQEQALTVSRVQPTKRPYVPLQQAAEVELKGDYYAEGGQHQESLVYYGVAAKLYRIAYPENHTQIAGITIKLGSAFRATGRLQSSQENLEAALYMLDKCERAPLELICECLFELGLTGEALENPEAGKMFEDVFHIVEGFHSLGESHRMMRLLPNLGRRLSVNHEEKFVYFSPFDYDRTFALADQALESGEAFYRKTNNTAGVIRVLTARKELIDKKFFNMRNFFGRIRTMRGHWMRRAKILTNSPTPEELLMYSPTVHQVHRDFRYENTAPVGLEGEVIPGVNRVVLDDGTPLRKSAKYKMNDNDRRGGIKRAEATRNWE